MLLRRRRQRSVDRLAYSGWGLPTICQRHCSVVVASTVLASTPRTMTLDTDSGHRSDPLLPRVSSLLMGRAGGTTSISTSSTVEGDIRLVQDVCEGDFYRYHPWYRHYNPRVDLFGHTGVVWALARGRRYRDTCIAHTLSRKSRVGSHTNALVDGKTFLAHLEDQSGCYRARSFVSGTSRRLRPTFLPSFSFPWSDFGCPAVSRRFGDFLPLWRVSRFKFGWPKLCCMCIERLGLTVMGPDCNSAW